LLDRRRRGRRHDDQDAGGALAVLALLLQRRGTRRRGRARKEGGWRDRARAAAGSHRAVDRPVRRSAGRDVRPARAEALGVATFVLVHGAWSGGWKWRLVAPMLRRAGGTRCSHRRSPASASAAISQAPESISARRCRTWSRSSRWK